MSWNSAIRGLLRELRFTLIRFEEDGDSDELEEAQVLLDAIIEEVSPGSSDVDDEPPNKSN